MPQQPYPLGIHPSVSLMRSRDLRRMVSRLALRVFIFWAARQILLHRTPDARAAPMGQTRPAARQSLEVFRTSIPREMHSEKWITTLMTDTLWEDRTSSGMTTLP